MLVENHLLIGLGEAGKDVLNACREYAPIRGVVGSVQIEQSTGELELVKRIDSKYKELGAAYERGGLSVHVFAGLSDTEEARYAARLLRLIRRTLPKFRLLVYVLLPNSVNRVALEELEAERHAFSLPRCVGQHTFALFLYAERNEYGYTVPRPMLSRMVADAVYFRIHNQRMPGFKFYAGEQFFNSGGSMQENTANSLGMVRIVYPEKQICEHIVCTLLEQVGWRLQNNQFMAGEGCADGTVPKDYRAMVLGLLDSWKLDEAYLTLDRLVDKPSEDTIFTYWNRLRGWTSYEEAKAENPNPLLFLDQRYETMYREQFRGHGVERYYNAESIFFRKCEIMKNVREDLYRRWHFGELSGRDVEEVVNTLRNHLVELQACIKEERIPNLEIEIKALEEERLSLHHEYMSLGIFARVVFHKDETLYNQYRDLLSQLYESKSRLKAYWFTGELLVQFINEVDYFLRVDIRSWVDGLETVQEDVSRRIGRLERVFRQTDGLVIGIFDRKRLQAFENSLMQDSSFMGSIRHKLSDYLSGLKEETPELEEIVQAAYELFLGEIKMFDDRNGGNERFFDSNLLGLLSQQSQNNPANVQVFVRSLRERVGAYIRLNPDETARLRQNNTEAGTFTGVLVCLPEHCNGEKQQEYVRLFKQACEEQFHDIIWAKGKYNEITIIKCLSGFSIRCLSD